MATEVCGSLDYFVHELESKIIEQKQTLKDHVEIQNALRADLIREKVSHDCTIEELNRAHDVIEELRSALFNALPFVEDCQGNNEYKRGVVAKCVREIKKELLIE